MANKPDQWCYIDLGQQHRRPVVTATAPAGVCHPTRFHRFRVTTLNAPTGRALRPIHGTQGQTLPAWLEPHREKFIHFVNVALRLGWDVSGPHFQRCHVRLGEKGVVLVFKSGHEMPQNADRLTRGQRLHFWRIVQKWVALEKANRDKSTKSGRSNRNVDCVNKTVR